MAIRISIRAAALAALVAGTGLAPAAPVAAADAHVPVIQVAASEATSRFIPLGIGKSVAIDLPADIKDVLVADPKIANAVIRSSRRVYMIGVAIGQTNIFFFDADGKQIAGFDIAVTRDLNGVRAALKQIDAGFRHPHRRRRRRHHVVGQRGQRRRVAAGLRSRHAAGRRRRQGGQRHLRARARPGHAQGDGRRSAARRHQAARRRSVRQLQLRRRGGELQYAKPFSANGQTLSNTAFGGSWKNVTATLRAMDRAGVLRTLAEPNLTAISGETASFVAGGEFPIPNGLSCDTTKSPPVCQAQVDFKKFGVSLVFTPVVLSEGRISLKVMTEVSDLSTDNALTLAVPGSTQTLTIPSISTRRAETTVEIPSGGSLALAGMIQEKTKQQINGVPGLMQLPILGTLFRSRDYINNQTELMVLVTPYVVRAVAQKMLSRPDDGFADPNDQSTALLGSLNRIYGARRQDRAAAASTTANTDSFSIERHGETIDDSLYDNACQTPGRRGAARIGGRRSHHLVGRLLHAAHYAERPTPTTIANAIRSP